MQAASTEEMELGIKNECREDKPFIEEIQMLYLGIWVWFVIA